MALIARELNKLLMLNAFSIEIKLVDGTYHILIMFGDRTDKAK